MSPADADAETAEVVIAHAANSGYAVSRHQLGRWQGIGLIPRPRQNGLGRGRGTQTLYAAGTKEHVLALCQIKKKYRSLDRCGWELWWRGLLVHEKYWRPVLQLAAKRFDRRKVDLLNPDGPSGRMDLVENFSTARTNIRVMRRIRKRVGAKKFPTFIHFVIQTAAGTFRGIDTTGDDRSLDTEILTKVLGTQGESVLAAISAAMPGQFQLILSSVEDRQIFMIRDGLNNIINNLRSTENRDASRRDGDFQQKVFELFLDEIPEYRSSLLVMLIALEINFQRAIQRGI